MAVADPMSFAGGHLALDCLHNNSVISSAPMTMFSTYSLPQIVLDRLERKSASGEETPSWRG